MYKKQAIFVVLIVMLLLTSLVYAEDIIEDIYIKQEKNEGDVYLRYKGKEYLLWQYKQLPLESYFSLQYWSPDEARIPEALMLYVNWRDKVVKEFKRTEYAADFIIHDVDGAKGYDLILFWKAGAHSTNAEVWLQDNNEFIKVFEKFTDKNVDFRLMDGIPALAFKKRYPMDVLTPHFPDSDYDFYEWDGKTFVLGSKRE